MTCIDIMFSVKSIWYSNRKRRQGVYPEIRVPLAQCNAGAMPDSKEVVHYQRELMKLLETELKVILERLVDSQFARLNAVNAKDELLGGC